MKNSIQIKAADTLKAAHGYSASVVRLRNTSAVSIDYSVSGGSAVELAAGASAIVDVAGLTSEIAVRRTDLSATPANVLLEFGLTADEAYEQSAADAAALAASITAADITDAGTAGIAVLQAETQAYGRTVLGVGGALTPVTTTALSGTQVVLTEASAHAQVFTLTADTIVKLPAGGVNTWTFAIFHGGGEFTLSINKADDTLLTARTAGGAATVVWDGTALGAY